ncbi:MAG: SIR2 family protein [Acidimicrobiaceae bacterium]|nr:SIR2 family protein [Acidimicrobiaceae bacterium]
MTASPMVSLASSVHAGPGTFALLLGSGISVSAGVPSGWGVMVELIRRLALLHNQDAGEDPVSWYRDQLGGEPDYSTIIEELAPSQADRLSLLSEFFEPTPQDQEDGLKVPTRAHHAIARLVADGYVRVIITTNLDRLLESALGDAGVNPSVISSPQHADGAMPMVHSPCTIIKVHGDYLSTDLRNTVEELAGYDEPINSLLDDVFDKYGLVVCGWSGTWDSALRERILGTPNRRFATYWLHRGPPQPHAQKIIGNRDAITVEIQDADTAMSELSEMVQALADAADQRPFDTAVAVARLKRHLPDPTQRIRAHDLVIAATDAVIDQISDLPMPRRADATSYRDRIELYEQAAAGLMKLLATGAFFSDCTDYDNLWVRSIERLAIRPRHRFGDEGLIDMQRYPTLLAVYALGVGAFAADRINPIARALSEIKVREPSHLEPLAVAASQSNVLGNSSVIDVLCQEPRYRNNPVSERLLSVLRPVMSEIAPHPDQQDDLFDQVAYLMAIAHAKHEARRAHLPRVYSGVAMTDFSPKAAVERHTQVLVESGLFSDHGHLTETGDAYRERLRHYSQIGCQFRI